MTIHFLHLIATTLYTHSIPRNWLWWGLQGASAALMTFLGVWACQWRELQPISFGGIGGSSSGGGSGPSSQPAGGENGESSRGRGRARDLGGNEYEMDEMKATGDQAV